MNYYFTAPLPENTEGQPVLKVLVTFLSIVSTSENVLPASIM